MTQRTDEYGGSLGNRMRLPPARGPRGAGGVPGRQAVLFRITGTDWVEGGTTIEESACSPRSRTVGGDLLDVSSGLAVRDEAARPAGARAVHALVADVRTGGRTGGCGDA